MVFKNKTHYNDFSTLPINQNKVQEKKINDEITVTITEEIDDELNLYDKNIKKNVQKEIMSHIYDKNLSERIISSACENIGVKYKTGGTTKSGFDCSGLIYATFLKFDIRLPKSSIEMTKVGSKIDLKNAQKADLIFFKTPGNYQVNHVGIVTEVSEEEIKFVHASTHKGVIISSTKEQYYRIFFVQINRPL